MNNKYYILTKKKKKKKTTNTQNKSNDKQTQLITSINIKYATFNIIIYSFFEYNYNTYTNNNLYWMARYCMIAIKSYRKITHNITLLTILINVY